MTHELIKKLGDALRTKYDAWGDTAHPELLEEVEKALAQPEQSEPDPQLCKFYQVATYPELVAIMEHHIRKLQLKLPIRDSLSAPSLRELSDEEIMALDCVNIERLDYEVFEVDRASVLEFAKAVLAAARSKT